MASRGAGVLTVGTSDETAATSLYGCDLYDDPLGALAAMESEPTHALLVLRTDLQPASRHSWTYPQFETSRWRETKVWSKQRGFPRDV